jgi:hypothetical protein
MITLPEIFIRPMRKGKEEVEMIQCKV